MSAEALLTVLPDPVARDQLALLLGVAMREMRRVSARSGASVRLHPAVADLVADLDAERDMRRATSHGDAGCRTASPETTRVALAGNAAHAEGMRKGLISKAAAADMLGISVRQLERRVRSHGVATYRFGRAVRIDPSDLTRLEA